MDDGIAIILMLMLFFKDMSKTFHGCKPHRNHDYSVQHRKESNNLRNGKVSEEIFNSRKHGGHY